MADGNEHLSNHIDFIRSYGVEPKKVESFGTFYSFFIPKGSVRGVINRTPKAERKVPHLSDRDKASVSEQASLQDGGSMVQDGSSNGFQNSSFKTTNNAELIESGWKDIYSALFSGDDGAIRLISSLSSIIYFNEVRFSIRMGYV
ncbi:MAG: hypothetical protein FWH35_00035 [Treponema sp.]|nr:hypothetical protein [Treponema sp.]